MPELADYAAFVAVVEHGSLTAAARWLGRSLQSVSRSLQSVERGLGLVLVQRTTRTCRPTEAGLAFLARLRPALAELALAHSEASAKAGRLSGRIRVSGPAMFGAATLVPLLAEFMRRHPAVEIDLVLGEAFSDLVSGGFDLAVRLGELPSSRLKARRLGTLRQVIFGAPAYFAARGWPKTLGDLAHHSCVIRTSAQEPTTWRFHRAGQVRSVSVAGPLHADTPAACNAAALAGLGIARAPLIQVRDDIDAGRLAIVLPEETPEPMACHLVWPAGRLPARVRLLVDHIARTVDLGRV